MKYWIFQSNQVLGPYGPDDLCGLATFSAESLVCPEGRRGTSMGDWQRAGMLPDLSGALVKATQSSGVKTPVLTLAGLPAEPTLKDLAVLGSLQEKTAMLEDAVLQLQESLRVKDAELAALHQELADKDKQAFELKRAIDERKLETDVIKAESQTLKNETETSRKRADELAAETELRRRESERLQAESEGLKQRIAGLEERVVEVRRISDAIEVAEKKVEHDVDESKTAHDAALNDLAHQIEEVRVQLREKTVMPSVAAESPAPPSSPAPIPVAVPTTEAAPVPISAANVHFSGAPVPAAVAAPAPEAFGSEPPNIAPPPAAVPAPGFGVPGPEFAAATAAAPMTAFGHAAPFPEAVAVPQPAFDPISATEAVAAPALPPEPVKPVAPPKKRKPLLVVAGVAAAVLVAFVVLAGRARRVVSSPDAATAATAAEPPAPVANAVIQTPAQTPPSTAATDGPAAGGPIENSPAAPAPAPVVVDPRQGATDAARSWKLDDGRMLGETLEALSPPSGNLSPWMAEPQPSGVTFVSYFAPAEGKPTIRYEFEVEADGKTVTARNPAAKSVMTGRPLDPPAPATPPKRNRHVKIKPKAAKPSTSAAPQPRLVKPSEAKSLDNVLAAPGGASGDAAPAPTVPKPAAAPAQKQESLDDLLKE
jgi:hypothetical protein